MKESLFAVGRTRILVHGRLMLCYCFKQLTNFKPMSIKKTAFNMWKTCIWHMHIWQWCFKQHQEKYKKYVHTCTHSWGTLRICESHITENMGRVKYKNTVFVKRDIFNKIVPKYRVWIKKKAYIIENKVIWLFWMDLEWEYRENVVHPD